MDIFTVRLKELRLEKCKTQKALADALKISEDSIYSWEKGRSQPSIEMIRELCAVLDCSADYLLGIVD
ncbi:helix-turn-helix domain-containing protein [Pumilibacter muris]|uniref:helix-turn-helix domain-containing protein n=1 Tax=Pumilibacter muris TaxID=2941510 RepID=UPI002040A1CD|nr:helix-turn-helix transcriptional regulator [Pumilibacter muris]